MIRVATVCLAVLALLVAGCGGGDDSYESDVQDVSQQLQNSGVSKQLQNVSSPQELADALNKAADEFDKAAKELEGLDPPGDAASAHRDLVAGVRATADDFRQVADQAATGKQSAIEKSVQQLITTGGAEKLRQALSELEKKGYDVQADGG